MLWPLSSSSSSVKMSSARHRRTKSRLDASGNRERSLDEPHHDIRLRTLDHNLLEVAVAEIIGFERPGSLFPRSSDVSIGKLRGRERGGVLASDAGDADEILRLRGDRVF